MEKKAIFDLLFTFLVINVKRHKNPFSTYLTYIYTRILLTLLPYQFLQKIRIYRVWFLFGVTSGIDSYSRHSGTTNKYQNGEQNLSWDVYY